MNTKNVKSCDFDTNGYDSKKIAYVMLSSELFLNCECSILNNNPKEFDNEYLLPRDMFVGEIITDKNVGSYTDFLNKLGNSGDLIFNCVCSLDDKDKERVVFLGLGDKKGLLSFKILSKSKNDPVELFKQLLERYGECL